jgi:hypothetical protein
LRRIERWWKASPSGVSGNGIVVAVKGTDRELVALHPTFSLDARGRARAVERAG